MITNRNARILTVVYILWHILFSYSFGLKRAQKPFLSQNYAEYRFQYISKVQYDLKIKLDTGQSFMGEVAVQFRLKKVQPVAIDFNYGFFTRFSINRHNVSTPDSIKNFFSLPVNYLREGKNIIRISYRAPYSNSGDGLYRFKDPADNRVYTYSFFEPYGANKMFPCFDQPNLKATLKLQVQAPAGWTVITATAEKKMKTKGRFKTWTFPATAPMSTYTYSLCAGPYAGWSSQAGKTPLRLFCRQSLAKNVQPEIWFRLTKNGFDFFNRYFEYPYPFKKYDQIIVPEFNMGAMENTAAVIYSERFISRGKEGYAQKRVRADVLLHEMAHMWFGDLVTMRWWDGLWLNESFATYMAALALYHTTEFKDAWQYFFQTMKQWAYYEDQLVTTHPIQLPVYATNEVFINFDGITYGKGAAFMKQLSYRIGAENFRKSMVYYFKQHAYGNADIQDLINAFEKVIGKSLTGIMKHWLENPGLNHIHAKAICDKTKLKRIEIKQGYPGVHPTLRPHYFQIGLLHQNSENRLSIYDSIQVKLEGSSISLTPSGKSCPLIIYPNYGDYGYFKVQLDSLTLKTASKQLAHVTDPHIRAMIWHNLWEMLTDAQYSLYDYVNLAIENLPNEDINNLIYVLKTINRWGQSYFYFPAEDTKIQKTYTQLLTEFDKMIWEELQKAEPGSELQKQWFKGYIHAAHSPEGLKKITQLLNGLMKNRGIRMTQDERWHMIYWLSAHGVPTSQSLARQEFKRDSSHHGKQARIKIEVAQPDTAVKSKWFKKVTDPASSIPFSEKKTVIYHLFPRHQLAFQRPFAKQFFDVLPKVFHKDVWFLRAFLHLAPGGMTTLNSEKVRIFLSKYPDAPPIVQKRLKVHLQHLERGIKVQALARMKHGI